jgi:hypothetical protein
MLLVPTTLVISSLFYAVAAVLSLVRPDWVYPRLPALIPMIGALISAGLALVFAFVDFDTLI